MELYNQIEEVFSVFVNYGILVLEFIGVMVLLVTAIKSVKGIFRKEEHVRLNLAQGIALSLEFKMGGEVLRTVIVRTKSELFVLGAIIVLRGILTFLIQWEIKNEEARIADLKKKRADIESANRQADT